MSGKVGASETASGCAQIRAPLRRGRGEVRAGWRQRVAGSPALRWVERCIQNSYEGGRPASLEWDDSLGKSNDSGDSDACSAHPGEMGKGRRDWRLPPSHPSPAARGKGRWLKPDLKEAPILSFPRERGKGRWLKPYLKEGVGR